MQVPPCKCIDFHAERRSRPPNGPATIGLALTLCSSIFRTVPQEPRATRSPKPHLRNQERTFHVSSLPRKTTARRSKRRRLLLGSTPSRRPLRDAPALGLAPVNRPRPRARRRLAPRERRTTRGELATSPRRQPPSFPNNALRRHGGEARVTERVARVYQQRQAVLRLCLYGVSRHSCRQARGAQQPAPAAVCGCS